MKILFTTEKGPIRDVYFPSRAFDELYALGEVTSNEGNTAFTSGMLRDVIRDKDACITHWSCPTFTSDVLDRANRLQLIVHAAGSIADLVTEDVFTRGIKVCSANSIMAKCVAEGVLAYFLAGLRWIPQQAYDVQYKNIWKKRLTDSKSLMEAKVGLVGLGTIGRYLLDLLTPFNVQIKLYDPYIPRESLQGFPNIELASLSDVLSWGEIISIHASLTHETKGMIDAEKISLIQNDALFVNTARGAIVDEMALSAELRRNRFRAILDVYEKEPLPLDSPLRNLENVILLPHVAGITAREQMSFAMIDEIKRYSMGKPLQYEIPFEKFKLMTKEH